MPLWKFLVEMVAGIFVFFLVDGLAQCVSMIPSVWVKIPLLVVVSLAVLALFLAWMKMFEKDWHSELLSTAVTKNLIAGLGIGLFFFLVVGGVLMIAGYYSPEYASPVWPYILLNFAFFFLVACGEEVIFRGILFRLIDERFGMWWALGISALVFGFVHILNPDAGVWSSIAIAIEAGLLLGAAYKFSGSLWFPIGIHWAWNFTQGNVFGFAVSGGDPGESILKGVVTGPALLTGGGFGPEASLITALLGLALSALFIYLSLRRAGAGVKC